MVEAEAIRKLRGLLVHYQHLQDEGESDEVRKVWDRVLNDLVRIINEEVPEEVLELHSGGFIIKKRSRAEKARAG